MINKFYLPAALAKLYPALTGEDLQFIRQKKDDGCSNIEAFRFLLVERDVAIPDEIREIYL